jgi:uncharacterized protein YbjT (DUF2867 family)
MSPLLITGASGNVGAEVVRLLRDGGYPVRAAVRTAPAARADDAGGVEQVPFDFAEPATFGPALRGVEKVFLVRPPALADTKRYFTPFIDAARRAGVEQIVFLSLLGAEKNAIVPHHAIEAALRASGVPWTFLRPSFFMQNLSTTHRADIRERGEILVPAGNGETSFIDARDIAAVGARVLTESDHLGRAYPLTGGEALGYAAVARIFSEVLGRPIAYRRPSLVAFARQMRRRGLAWSFILVMAGIYTTARLGLAGTVTPDTATLLERAPITMRQFVADYQACWR